MGECCPAQWGQKPHVSFKGGGGHSAPGAPPFPPPMTSDLYLSVGYSKTTYYRQTFLPSLKVSKYRKPLSYSFPLLIKFLFTSLFGCSTSRKLFYFSLDYEKVKSVMTK